MLTLTDLIAQGVAEPIYKNNVVTTTGNDRFIINYNNIWGMISDTHMSKGDDGNYYITGQLFRDEKLTNDFLLSAFWGGYCFKDSSLGVTCLQHYLELNGYNPVRIVVNGDDVLGLIEITKE